MEPQTPTPNTRGPEGGFFSERPRPSEPSTERYRPYEGVPSPDQKGERQESRERITGAGAGDGDLSRSAPPVSLTPTVNIPKDTNTAVKDDTPLVAADEDLIEMEWVKKAKAIVTETKTDPYTQEREVSKLQANYLLKRYGKEVKLPKDE